MHSLIVTERRGGFRAWTLLLAIAAFSLSLLGTFLVRSGVLTSVHAFASDPQRGLFILGFLVAVVGGSLTLFALRGPSVTGDAPSPEFSASSREGYLLANNLLMVTAAGSVLLGTLYPLVLDTLDLAKISVGPPYFEAVFFPLMAPAAFLMGVGPLARWRQAPLPSLAQRLKWAFAIALVTMIATLVMRDTTGSGSLFGSIAFASGIFLGIWLIVASGVALQERASQVKAPNMLERWRALPASTWAMALAHAGVGVFCIGVACVKTLEVEIDSALGPQETLTIGGYRMTLTSMGEVQGPNYRAVRARIEVQPASGAGFVLEPEKRFYPVTQSVMTEAAIESGFTRDVYVSLGEQLPDGRWTVKAWVKPFIDWIWAGCFLMALGGFLTMVDRRYRATRVAALQPTEGAATASARLG
jgi:cytochrome c-type biogenesis protein CcmF